LDSLGHVCQSATGGLGGVVSGLPLLGGVLGGGSGSGGAASGACNLVSSGLPVTNLVGQLTGTLHGLLGGLNLPILGQNTPLILAIVYNLNIYLAVIV